MVGDLYDHYYILLIGWYFSAENVGIPRVDVYYAPKTRVATKHGGPFYGIQRGAVLIGFDPDVYRLDGVVFFCRRLGGILKQYDPMRDDDIIQQSTDQTIY